METSVVKEIIKWAIENAFNVETKDGTRYIATDYEEMRKKFDEWLEFVLPKKLSKFLIRNVEKGALTLRG